MKTGKVIGSIFSHLFARRPQLWVALFLVAASVAARNAAAAVCFTAPSGLVGWWSGDGNASDIFGTNNGTLQGSATATGVGEVGQSFSFNGTTAYVSIPDSATFHPAAFTVEAWVKFNSLNSTASGGSPAGDQYIVFKQNTRVGDFEGIDLSKTRIGGKDVFRFLVTSATAQTAEIDSTTAIVTNTWYHIAAVRGSNFTQLYVNGALAAQMTVTFAQDYGTLPLFFGSSGQSYWDHKLSGLLDEVSLYNRPLASNEIASIYAAGVAGKCKGAQPPLVVVPPQTQSVAQGGNANFSVSATGTAPLSYQWLFNGATIPGATATNFTVTNVQATNAGSYAVVVTNVANAVTSSPAVLTVLTAPVITLQPLPSTNLTGDVVTFTAAATGSTPLSYQWQLNGTNLANNARISGARTNSLTISNVAFTDAGNYVLLVSNAAGATNTAPASLTVNGPPTITAQPAPQSVFVGANVSFVVAATGTQPLAYQWSRNGAPISDAGNVSGTGTAVLTLTNVQLTDSSTFQVLITNVAGATNSVIVGLTVNPAPVPPSIAGQPAGLVVIAGTNVSFTVSAGGTTPLSYQWLKNNVALTNGGKVSGANTATLSLSNVQTNDTANYLVVVTNVAGSTNSAPAALIVYAPPTITAQPASLGVLAGTNVSFSVGVSGTAPFGFQWRFNNTNLSDGGQFSGTATATLSVASVQSNNAGNYSVIVTNIAGSTNSVPAILAVTAPGSCDPAPAGLVGWWTGDGNANDSVGGNNGTFQSGANAAAVGEVGPAFSFNGTTSYISIPDSQVFHPTNLTIGPG